MTRIIPLLRAHKSPLVDDDDYTPTETDDAIGVAGDCFDKLEGLLDSINTFSPRQVDLVHELNAKIMAWQVKASTKLPKDNQGIDNVR